MLELLWFLRLFVLGFRSRLPLLPDQGCQGLSEWKLLSDGLDNIVQFFFATSKGMVFVGRRNGEIERGIPDRVPGERLFQTPIFVGRQNKKEVANPFSHFTTIELDEFHATIWRFLFPVNNFSEKCARRETTRQPKGTCRFYREEIYLSVQN
jgi:hypothetical protein